MTKIKHHLLTGIFLPLTLTVFAPLARGQLLTIHSFNGSDGGNPSSELVQGSDGLFYGTTAQGGPNGLGTVYKITSGGVLTTLGSFDGSNGRNPYAGLVEDANNHGTFYGVTLGDQGTILGTAFNVTSTPGGLALLANFSSANNGGLFPWATLIEASDGTFYGTAYQGGLNTAGTVFQLTTGGTLTTVVKFNGSNGGSSHAGMIRGIDGNFYGTTSGGGANGFGTVFRLTPNGINSVLTTLASFDGVNNGSQPDGVLLQMPNGDFYGTASSGGANNKGTVFKMTVNGTTGTLTTLASFTGANGWKPTCGLVLANDGNFYGTAQQGGDLTANSGFGWGTVFKMTPTTFALTAVVVFNNTNGSFPYGGLVKGTDGNLYGTTDNGGAFNSGTVFKFGITSLTCATNKTVACGSAWTFDPPTATNNTCNGTNITLAILSTVTNGICPQVITQTWTITDACSNTAICSQIVTVVDTRAADPDVLDQ